VKTFRRLGFAATGVASTLYALLLGVYAVASTRPEINTQPQSDEEIRATLAALGIASEYSFAHGFAATPHGRMHYAQTGSGKPMLFLHGSATWSYEFRHLMAQLAGEGQMIAPDLIGCGLSEKRSSPTSYTLDGHIEDIAALVGQLDLRDLVLVMQDWGVPIGLGVWLRDPSRIRGLVVMNSFGLQSLGGSFGSVLARSVLRAPVLGEELVQGLEVPQRVGLPLTLELPSGQERSVVHSYARVQGSWSERAATLAFARMVPRDPLDEHWVMARAAAALHKHAPPALIVWGLDDRSFGPSALREWRAALPGAPVEEIRGAGALVPEEAPAAASAAIARFLHSL
jgi:pimeloyl-ACP methyl ester carboxylesterase